MNSYCYSGLPDTKQLNVVVICRVNVIALACINTTWFCVFCWKFCWKGARFFLQRDNVKLLQTV